MRRPHYWRKNRNILRISDILYVDTETRPIGRLDIDGIERHTLSFGWCMYTRYVGGKRTRVKWYRFESIDEFWDIVDKIALSKRILYICAHNMRFDFAILGGWEYIHGNKIKRRKMMIDNSIFYIDCTIKGKHIRIIDSTSYYRTSINSMGKMIGLQKLKQPKQDDPIHMWDEYCKRDVEIMAKCMEHLIGTFQSIGYPGLSYTISSCAMGIYRQVYMKHKILVHDYKEVYTDERSSYFGGIVWFTRHNRRIDGPIYELDVCSLYPYCCTLPLPYQYIRTYYNISVNQLESLCSSYGVIAKVCIDTNKRIIPYRDDAGSLYAIGRFTTTLAKPEILYCIKHGLISGCERVHIYREDTIFREYMLDMVSRKEECRRGKNYIMANIYKMLANSLYGKTGQKQRRVYILDSDGIKRLKRTYSLSETDIDILLDTVYTCDTDRFVYTIPSVGKELAFSRTNIGWFVNDTEQEGYDTVCAIASTVTSYGRCVIYDTWDMIGMENVYYTDTDSIWTNNTGLEIMSTNGIIGDNTIGRWQCKGQHEYLVVYGRKDYETDMVRRTKGIRFDARPAGINTYVQTQFEGVSRQIKRNIDNTVIVQYVTKSLSRRPDRVCIDSAGDVSPIKLGG